MRSLLLLREPSLRLAVLRRRTKLGDKRSASQSNTSGDVERDTNNFIGIEMAHADNHRSLRGRIQPQRE